MAVTINASTSSGLQLTSDTSGAIQLQNNGTNTLGVDGSGNVTLQNNISIGGATPTTSGSGITFPATQSASTNTNTLDDYEEGTFTPTVIGTTIAGTATYSVQDGRYTKIGNRVLFQIYLVWTSGTGTGDLQVISLPFTSTNQLCNISVYANNLTSAASTYITAYVASNSAGIRIEYATVATAVAGQVAYDAAATLIMAGQYQV